MFSIKRRELFAGLSLLSRPLRAGLAKHGPAHGGATSIGAIRWDPWYMKEDVGPRTEVEATLSSPQWIRRSPSCSRTNGGKLDLEGCTTQLAIDKEIQLARQAGLDFWAFAWYGVNSPLQEAWRRYCASRVHQKPRWCILLSSKSATLELASQAGAYRKMLSRPLYQTVLQGRPLILFLPEAASDDSTRRIVDSLHSLIAPAEARTPYVVALTGTNVEKAKMLKADAIGIYSKEFSAPSHGTYADLASQTEQYWNSLRNLDFPCVPTAVTGADRRPRIEHPVGWEAATQKPNVGLEKYYEKGSPQAIGDHVKRMVQWIETNPRACPAQAGLIYSWNEFDEGGSTLSPTLEGGTQILDRVGFAIRTGRAK